MRCLTPGSGGRRRLADMALLEVEDLSIGYRTRLGLHRAVEGVSFSLEEGKSLGFVGESGCGKTTVGMSLMGLLPRNGEVLRGRVLFEGRDILSISEEELRLLRWKKISMIFQAAMNALNPVKKVADQISEAILAHSSSVPKAEASRQVEGLFQLVGVPKERMRDYPHQYSGGMKQRAVIAMALACKPRLIIADEPTTALDVIVQAQILEETRLLQEQLGISIIFISHDISIVADVCHDIGIMYAGELVEYGSREEVFDSPAHPYTRALLSSFPTLTGNREMLKPIPGEPPNLVDPPKGCRFRERCQEASHECSLISPAWTELFPRHKVRCIRFERKKGPQ